MTPNWVRRLAIFRFDFIALYLNDHSLVSALVPTTRYCTIMKCAHVHTILIGSDCMCRTPNVHDRYHNCRGNTEWCVSCVHGSNTHARTNRTSRTQIGGQSDGPDRDLLLSPH